MNRNLKATAIASCVTFLFATQAIAQHTCPTMYARNNGNGQSSQCAGVSGTPVATDMTGSWATVPTGSKTADVNWKHNVTDAWYTNPPVIVAVYSTANNTSTKLNSYPGPAGVPTSGQGVQYCFYTGSTGNGNMPNAGIISFRFATPTNVSDYLVCTYDFGNSNATIANPATVNVSPLDVKFIGFDIANRNNQISINWSVASPVNVAEYTVERSFDGSNFERIYTTADITATTFSYVDDLQKSNVNGAAFYRVKEIDVDGKETLTAVQRTQLTASESLLNVYYAANKVVVQSPSAQTATVQYINLAGQILSQEQVSLNNGNNYFNISNSNSIGLVRVIASNNVFFCKVPLQ